MWTACGHCQSKRYLHSTRHWSRGWRDYGTAKFAQGISLTRAGMTSLQALRAGGPCGERSVERPNNPKEGLNGNSFKQINMPLGRGRGRGVITCSLLMFVFMAPYQHWRWTAMTWICVIFVVLHGALNGQNSWNPSPTPQFGNVSFKILYSNRDSSVGIATACKLGDEGVGVRVKNFLFSTSSRSALGPTQPPNQWVTPGVKRSRREADHSPPASAKVKQMWTYTSTSPYTFMA
jgi:hypothetical protein